MPQPETSEPFSENEEFIDPKELIERMSIEEFNRYSDEYYKLQPRIADQLGKPFAMGHHAAQHLVRLGLVLESMRLGKGMKVLDFGAGTCWISKALWQMGCAVVATDVSAEALRLGRQLFNDYPIPNDPPYGWETRLFDGRRIPMEDEEADRVLCFDAFHHVPNPEAIIEEFYRVLRNGGSVVFNEPLGEHSSTPESQSEMRQFRVLENDLDMAELRERFMAVGFESPRFKVAAAPGFAMDYEEWQLCREGSPSRSTITSLSQFQRNSGVFIFQKGLALLDSRQLEGLSHEIECESKRLRLKVGKPTPISVTVKNAGEARWLHKNDGHVGVVHIATRLLDRDTRDLIADNSRFRMPKEMEPGDTFTGEVPITVKRPGKFWLKLDLVSESVCWFESFGSKPILIEADVEA